MAAGYDLSEIKRKVNQSGKLAFDIETTGKTAVDQFIAVGYAWKRHDGSTVRGHCALRIVDDEDLTQIEQGELTWREVWHLSGFEMRCFDEFWHPKNKKSLLDLVHSFQREENAVRYERELATRINAILREAEEHWDGKLQIITDTTAYDTCWLHKLLVEHNFHPLDTTRAGVHRWTYDLDSFVLGSLGTTPDTVNWRNLSAFQQVLSRLPVDSAEHSHHPADDAQFILAKFEAVEMFNAMMSNSILDVFVSKSSDYPVLLAEHLQQTQARIEFLRDLSHSTEK